MLLLLVVQWIASVMGVSHLADNGSCLEICISTILPCDFLSFSTWIIFICNNHWFATNGTCIHRPVISIMDLLILRTHIFILLDYSFTYFNILLCVCWLDEFVLSIILLRTIFSTSYLILGHLTTWTKLSLSWVVHTHIIHIIHLLIGTCCCISSFHVQFGLTWATDSLLKATSALRNSRWV